VRGEQHPGDEEGPRNLILESAELAILPP
jgi:hypothetical protein